MFCKCKLNILTLLTFLNPLDCLISDKDIMINVLLLQTMGDKNDGEWLICVKACGRGRDRQGVSHFSIFLLCFCAIINCFFMSGS